MFELAQLNVFTPDAKKGGGGSHVMASDGTGGGMEYVGRTCTWTPTWSEIMEIGGFDPSAATGGRMLNWCTSSPPAPSPSPRFPQSPQPRDPRGRIPPTPPDTFTKALGAISLTPDKQGIVCKVHSSADL